MNPKFSLKVIQQGQTQKVHVITPGAGLQGQALVVQAKDATRYQLADIVTLSTPEKLQMKRVGGNLHIALPGGDVDAPDIVIEDYYNVRNATVQGQTLAGEWRGYTTANLVDTAAAASAEQGALASGKGWFSSLWGSTGAQSVGMASMDSSAVSSGAGSSAGFAGMSMGTLAGVGALGALALGGGGGGGGGGASADTSALGVIKAYASSGGTSAAPSTKNYSDAGVSLPSGISDALNILNAVVALQSSSAVDSADKLNALANAMSTAYNKIIAEANGPTTADATPDANPSVADFASVGIKVADAIGNQTNASTGAGNETLKLLDSAIGDLTSTSVNTAAALKKLAITANDVMLLAKGSAATQTDSDLITGLNAMLGGSQVTSANLAAIKSAITATNDNGTEVDSIAALKTVVDAQVLKTYAATGDGVNSAPAFQIYKDAGIKVPAYATSASDNTAIDDSTVLSVLNSISSANWQTALASALVKINAGTLASKTTGADIVSAVQAMVHSYYRILAAADGNTTTAPVTPSADDYSHVGATVSSDANVMALLNDYVGGSSLKTAGVDTVNEINAVAKAAYNVMRLADSLHVAEITAMNYADTKSWVAGLNTLLGGNSVTETNWDSVKIKIQGVAGGIAAVDTVKEVQILVDGSLALYTLQNYANTKGGSSPAPSLQNYKDAPIKVLNGLSETDANASGDITFGGGNTVPALYGMSTANWLNAINSALALQASNPSTGTLQSMVDSYYRILSEADGKYLGDGNTYASASDYNPDVYPGDDTKLDPTKDDYVNVGVKADLTDSNTLALLNDAVGRSSTASVDTATKLNDRAVAAFNVMKQQAGGTGVTYSSASEWVSGLTSLGVTGVANTNVEAVKASIDAAANATSVDTVQELQKIVSLVRMQAFTDDPAAIGSKSAPTPTLDDWKAIGVKALGSLTDTTANADLTSANTNLTAINSALDRWDGTSVTQSNMQGVVNAYARILAEADGSHTTDTDVHSSGTITNNPAQSDYESVMGGTAKLAALVGSADSHWLDLLNSCVGTMASSAVASAGQIEAMIKASAAVMNQALTNGGWSYTSDTEWTNALTSLGVTGLTGMSSTDLATIKSNIAAIDNATPTAIDTWAELQGIVSLVRINNYAADNTKATPGITDYQAFFDYNVSGHANLPESNNATYLNAFSDAVNYKPSNSFTASEVKSLVDGYTAILAEANGSSPDQYSYNPTAADYLAVGVGTGTSYDTDIRIMLGDADHDGVINHGETSSRFADLLTDVVANKNASDVNSVLALNNLAKIVLKIQQLSGSTDVTVGTSPNYTPNTDSYTAPDGGALQVSELTSLGLDTSLLNYNSNGALSQSVYTHRVNNVYDHIINSDGTHLSTLAQIQQIINNTAVINT